MQRLALMWNDFCAGNPVIGVRGLAVLTFLAISGASLARGFQHASLSDFLGGMSIALAGILMFQTFSLESARTKRDPDESPLTGLHLSR